MKRYFISILLLGTFGISQAQWNVNGNHIYNSNSGSVGVGLSTGTPLGKFHIQYSSNVDWSAYIYNAGGSGKGLWVKSACSSCPAPIFQATDLSDNVRFIVLGDGKTGVGVSTPASKFEVNGTISMVRGNRLQFLETVGGPPRAFIESDASNNLKLHVGSGVGVDAIYVTPEGNTGLKTTSPQGALQVNSIRPIILKENGGNGVYGSEIGFNAVLNTNVLPNQFRKLGNTSQQGGANIAVDNDGNMLFQMYDANTVNESIIDYVPQIAFRNTGFVGMGITNPESPLHVKTVGQQIKFLVGTNTSGYSLSLGVNDDGINFSNNSSIRGFNFSNNTGNLFRITSDGKVGIGTGTQTPDAKLAVKGTIHAEEVKVDLTVPGPDYVFEPTYQLPSLTEIENYIKANKHLPEVPSAKEMEANGINLSEMNMLLLKKVEELTLYMIKTSKQVEELKVENKELKKSIELLNRKD